ncbi:intraflagellar transport protein 46 homolog [Vespa crabro]|uniref:intraflagellar transport protein 46 homolog n=1 Tax=Vespa crabro TaxID=7445 RepID=UPI001F010109|nr:intraflagellar transport protein 46 homolog [Vespa crabro]
MTTMDVKESSEEDEEETQDISPFSKFDESIEVRNAEEIKSPVNHPRPPSSRKGRRNFTNDGLDILEVTSPRERREFRRYPDQERFGKSLMIGSDPSDSEETDDDDIQESSISKQMEIYNPKEFEDLNVSTELKELFQNISRYTPQKIELNYKLLPFIPDYIPAVGDIDAFIKIPRPDGVEDKIGLAVLDEPCTEQSDPAVLHLQLRTHCRSAGAPRQAVIKRVEDAEKNVKAIEKWIEDMNQLHRSKHPPAVQLTKAMPDIDTLMQQWPPDVEDQLNEAPLDFTMLDCELSRLVDIVCHLLDIPSHDGYRLESLHTLFTLYCEIRNATSQKI